MLPSAADCMRRAAAQQYKQEIVNAGYNLKNRRPVIGGVVGGATHLGVEATIKHFLVNGVYAKINDCIEIGIENLKSNISDGIIWDQTTFSANEGEKQVAQMIKSYCIQIAPTISPVNMEKQFEATINDDVCFSGKIDIDTTENDIRDTKTGVKPKPFQCQLGGYSLLRKAKHNKITNRLLIDYLPRVSTKRSYPGASTICYNVSLCENMAYDIITRISLSVKLFRETGNCFAFPNNPMSILCLDKYCIAYGTNFCKL